MKIEGITLREIRMPLVSFFETSFGRTDVRRILLLEMLVDGLRVWSEVTCGETPFYSHETTDTARHILAEFAIPMVLGKEVAQPADVRPLMRLIRGHEMARAAIENALWDAWARQLEQPLWKLLGGTRNEIPCGVSIGIKNSVPELLDTIDRELASGYLRIKVKVKPGWDLNVLEAIRKKFPEVPLMADANSAYTLDDTAHLVKMDEFHLTMVEQPLWYDDICLHARLQAQMQTPLCLDESIHHARDAALAIECKACRVINIKLGRTGGFSSAREVHDVARAAGIPVWCGGMLESGVGRVHNIALSTLPGFSLPGDVSASRRYWREDIVEPEVEVTPRGTIVVRDEPGTGYRVKTELIRRLTVWEQHFGVA